ncbi:hypothetical protein BHE74_00009485 [Ensete ventricosum]|nr:hypothetical protein BHE74_00009485 [Ensete ventricosum]
MTVINFTQRSSFNRFFIYRLKNSKFKPFPTYLPLGSHTSLVSRKNITVKNFAQSHVQSRVSIGFSCTISKIQNAGHFQRIMLSDVIRARFHEKMRRS